MPGELNPNYSIFGGQLIAWLDKDLYVFASGEVKYTRMVTYGMHNIYFKNPAFLGEIIEIYGKVTQVKKASVTVSGKAVATDPVTGNQRLIIECEITYVALDENGKPVAALKRVN